MLATKSDMVWFSHGFGTSIARPAFPSKNLFRNRGLTFALLTVAAFAAIAAIMNSQQAFATDYLVDQTGCESLNGSWLDSGWGDGSGICYIDQLLVIQAGDHVSIPSGVFLVLDSSNSSASIENYGTLTIDFDPNCTDNCYSALQLSAVINGVLYPSTLYNYGTIEAINDLNIHGGTLNNEIGGIIDLQQGGDLNADENSELNNDGDIFIGESSILSVGASVGSTDGGTVNNSSDGQIIIGSLGYLFINPFGVLNSSGTITNDGLIYKNCGGTFNNTGTLNGSGSLNSGTCPTVTIDAAVVDKRGTTVNNGQTTSKTSITFTFHGNGGTSPYVFSCSLDGGTPTPCVSGVTYSHLSLGSHTFEVTVTDQGLNSDSTTWDWSIKRGKK